MKSIRPNSTQGYTFLELMIAMSLGLVLIGGAIQTLISNKQTFNITNAIGSTEEGGRFSMHFLTQDIRMAGYSSNPQSNKSNPFFVYNADGTTNAYCTADSNDWCSKEGGGTISDQISVLKEIDTIINSDCNGNATTSEPDKSNMLANVYWIAHDTTNDNQSSLFCRGYDVTAATWLGNALPMIGGVESLQALYGEVNSDGDTRYVSLDRVEKMTRVIAVKIGVLVAENGNGSLSKKSRSYSVLDARPFTYDDKKNRTLYSTTVFLSNAKLYSINQGLGY
ncbi:MAG: PilW family protein [Pseudomonadales bacterium]|nr:PilW family protein [Pseudomonadales bacterium]